jgi:hypothetical protein
MLQNLKLILEMMKDNSIVIPKSKYKECILSLECAIEILEKLRNEERRIQNGNIE